MEVNGVLVILTSLLAAAHPYLVLHEKAHIQLNDVNGGKTIDASSYNRIDFDFFANILYVLAKEPGRMTAFSVSSDGTPTQLTEWVFDTDMTGHPLDVEFCRPSSGTGPPRVAISFEDPSSVSADGVVRIYRGLTPLATDMELIKEITVGAQPVDLEFTEDCKVLLAANRGRPSKQGATYRDPEGTVTKITTPTDLNEDSPVITTTISFGSLLSGTGSTEYLRQLREKNFRHPPVRQPDNTLLTVMQNLEPENIAIVPNTHFVDVSLPKNNAIARLNIETNQASIIYPMGNRSWTDYYMDASDKDREINLRSYNIYSLLQPTGLKWIVRENHQWLITLDTGRFDESPVYQNPDYERGSVLMHDGNIATTDGDLRAQLLDNNELGRLLVSTEDGKRSSDGKIENVVAFGGRGFSIHDARNFLTVTGVVDNIEQVTKQFFKDVFNTAYLANYETPESNAEATSPSLGPNLGAMDVGEYDGKTVIFLGSATSGVLYVYQLSPDTDCPQPVFHSVHRAGSTMESWSRLYTQGSMGDIGITDMMYLKSDNLLPVLVVASATSNSISVYSVADESFAPEHL